MALRADEGDHRDGDLGGITALENYVRMRLHEIPTDFAAQQCPPSWGFWVGEDVPTVELFSQSGLTTGTAELPVERVLGFGLGGERVLITLDNPPD